MIRNFCFCSYLFLFFFVLSLTAGCGSANSVGNNTAANAAVKHPAKPANDLLFNSNTIAPATNPTIVNVPATPGNIKLKNDPTQSGTISKAPAKEAPDNSEISTSLAENFVQTRTFKNHPQLKKVEVTMLTKENNRKVIKIYLKSGQVVEVSKEKVLDPMVESAENILKAAQ